MYRDLGMLDRAILLCRRAAELAPRSERASLGLFHALWDSERFDEALEEIKRFQLLTNWSCQDYLDIMAEIKEKWLDETPAEENSKGRRKSPQRRT
jgi:hypothetical protein